MSFRELMSERRSVRQFSKDPVPPEILNEVIASALYTPSWANKQCWRLIVVDSRVEKRILGNASGQERIVRACDDAPAVIVLATIPKESGTHHDIPYHIFDGGMIMQSLILAAKEAGLGTCVIGWFDEKAVRAVLNIPEEARILAYTPVGYPAEEPRARPRRDYHETVYHNLWGKNQ